MRAGNVTTTPSCADMVMRICFARGLRRMLQSATGSPADKGEPATPDWVSGAAQVARAANTLRKGVKIGRLIR